MELMTWSDGRLEERLERIDERFQQVDRRFEQVDRRFEQVDKRFEQVDRRFEQVDKRFDRVEGDIAELRTKLDHILIGLLVGFPTVIGTILVKGG